MTARLLEGKVLAEKLKRSLKKELDELKHATGQVPHIVNILVGNDRIQFCMTPCVLKFHLSNAFFVWVLCNPFTKRAHGYVEVVPCIDFR